MDGPIGAECLPCESRFERRACRKTIELRRHEFEGREVVLRFHRTRGLVGERELIELSRSGPFRRVSPCRLVAPVLVTVLTRRIKVRPRIRKPIVAGMPVAQQWRRPRASRSRGLTPDRPSGGGRSSLDARDTQVSPVPFTRNELNPPPS